MTISRLTGTPSGPDGTATIIDVGGVGYAVHLHDRDRAVVASRERVTLHVRVVVGERSTTMYGFVDEGDRFCFDQLVDIPKIGATTALRLLSVLTPWQLDQAMKSATPVKVPNVGASTWQRLIEAAKR